MTADDAGVEGLGRFLARFDRGEYWLAHEELEELWLASPRPAYKGLIHLAAACLHWERGNLRGAATKLRSAKAHIEDDRGTLEAFDIEALLAEIRRLEAALAAGQEFDRFRLAPLTSIPVGGGVRYRTAVPGHALRRGISPGARSPAPRLIAALAPEVSDSRSLRRRTTRSEP